MLVVMRDVLVRYRPEVPWPGDEHPVGDLGTKGPGENARGTVYGVWGSGRGSGCGSGLACPAAGAAGGVTMAAPM